MKCVLIFIEAFFLCGNAMIGTATGPGQGQTGIHLEKQHRKDIDMSALDIMTGSSNQLLLLREVGLAPI